MGTELMMDALVIEQHGQAALRRMPRPEVPPGGVMIRVHYSGVSIGTEMLQGTGKHSNLALPFIAGYQAAGEVVEVGPDTQAFQPGDPVTIFCRGSHASFAVANADRVQRIASLDAAYLSSLFVQPCVGANALDQAGVRAEDSVLVIGQGMIGQATAALARLRGCFVAATDVSPSRLAVSAAHCADWAIDARVGPMAQQIARRYPKGFSVVLETTGSSQVLDDALNCCTQGGRFSFVGYHPGRISLPFNVMHVKELQTHFPWFIGKQVLRDGVLRLIGSGAFPMRPLISHSLKWSEVLPLYQTLFTPERDALNAIVIDWRDAS